MGSMMSRLRFMSLALRRSDAITAAESGILGGLERRSAALLALLARVCSKTGVTTSVSYTRPESPPAVLFCECLVAASCWAVSRFAGVITLESAFCQDFNLHYILPCAHLH